MKSFYARLSAAATLLLVSTGVFAAGACCVGAACCIGLPCCLS